MKLNIFILLLLTITFSFGQSLNDYKYILVPETFEEMKEPDQYRLNGLTNYLFNQNGFNSYLGKSNLPEDALNNNCLVLNAELVNESGLFTTKVAIKLVNCKGEVVYTSPIGGSREKKYIVAYNEALRASLNNLSVLNYDYQPKEYETTNTITKATDQVTIKSKTNNLSKIKSEESVVIKSTDNKMSSQLKAVKLENTLLDYEVFNSENTLVFKFLYSGSEDVYIIENTNAIVYKKGDNWVLADRTSSSLELKVLNITFN